MSKSSFETMGRGTEFREENRQAATAETVMTKLEQLGATALAIKAGRDELLTVLRRLLARHDPERVGAMDEPDSGCIECTSGAVPNRLNTGLCPLHQAERLIDKVDRS